MSASPRSQAAGPRRSGGTQPGSDDPRELKRQSRRHRLAAGHAPSARDQQSPSTDARSTRRSPRASNSAVSHAPQQPAHPPSQRARSPRAEHGRSARSPRATATAQTPASCRPLDAPTCRTSVTATTGRHDRSHAQLPPGGCPRRGWSFHDFVRLLRSQRRPLSGRDSSTDDMSTRRTPAAKRGVRQLVLQVTRAPEAPRRTSGSSLTSTAMSCLVT